jgi:hypothetical protein
MSNKITFLNSIVRGAQGLIEKGFTSSAKIVTKSSLESLNGEQKFLRFYSVKIKKSAYKALQSAMTKAGDQENSKVLKHVFNNGSPTSTAKGKHLVGTALPEDLDDLRRIDKQYAHVRSFSKARALVTTAIAGALTHTTINQGKKNQEHKK